VTCVWQGLTVIDNPWTAKRVAELRRLMTDGLSFSRIAARLKISRNAVIGKARRLGVAQPAKSSRQGSSIAVREVCQARHSRPLRRPTDLPRRPIPPAVAADALNLRIDQLERDHCRYITNEDLREATYCGHRTAEGTSWCAFHLRRVRGPALIPSPPLAPALHRTAPTLRGRLHEA
jgi:GcrA cell cycle regulator